MAAGRAPVNPEPLLIEQAPESSPLPPVPLINAHTVCSTNALLGAGVLRPLGVVRGVTVRSRNIGASIGAGFQAMRGGEVSTMTTLCETARAEALQRMLENAAERGATGILAMRFDANGISPGVTEIIAYGMAVTDAPAQQITSDAADGAGGAGAGASISREHVSTSNEMAGYNLQQSLGVVQGLTVRSRNVFASFGAGLKTIVGGEISTWTKMCEDARNDAYARMLVEAVCRGADGVIAMRYESNELAPGITEILAFGTAVSSKAENIIPRPPTQPLDDGMDIAQAQSGLADCLSERMITTSNVLPGFTTRQSLGLVQGLSVQSCHLFASIGAGLKAMVGGEIHAWSGLCSSARSKALKLMLEDAKERGAKGVVAVRYDSNRVRSGVIETIAYGTAVSDEELPAQAAVVAAAEGGGNRFNVTTDVDFTGAEQESLRSLGVAQGISVRSCNVFLKIGAGFKSVVGGEIRNYTKVCEDARKEAYDRMVQHAITMGATGITGMFYESNDMLVKMKSTECVAMEMICYGTAVRSVNAVNPLPAAAPADQGQTSVIDPSHVSTTDELAGQQGIECSLGVVRGLTVRSRNFVANCGATLKGYYVGGEISSWSQLCEDTRKEAFERMLAEALQLGAKGVVSMRYETNEVAEGITEVIAYGTAVA
jgi:uncharacterized protein YbjQ (UPF0145 family)